MQSSVFLRGRAPGSKALSRVPPMAGDVTREEHGLSSKQEPGEL